MDSLTRVLNSSPFVRKVAGAALLAGVVAIGAGVVAGTVVSLTRHAEAVQAQREQLGRLQAVLAMKPMLEKAGALDSEAMDRPEFLAGASDAVIQAELQAWLSLVAEKYRIEVTSVGNAPRLEQDGVRYAGLRANLAGRNHGMLALIFDIETAQPYLTISQAQLHSTLKSQEPNFRGAEELVLQVQFYGALPPENAAAAEAAGATQ